MTQPLSLSISISISNRGKKSMSLVNSKQAKRYIPLDITIEILSWLPARSLVRFRRVCKLWRSITHDPDFINTHLERSRARKNRPPSILLFLPDFKRDRLCITFLDSAFVLKPILSIPTPENRGIRSRVLDSCNGLLFIHGDDGCMEVMNPATGASLTPPAPTKSRIAHRSYFGFHPVTKEYKVIRFFARNSSSFNACEVYTLGTSSWRRIRSPDYFPSKRAATVKGAMYWYIYVSVLSFDLKDESFTRIPPPNFKIYGNEEPPTIHELVELQGSVCLPVFTEAEIDIWMLSDDHGTKHEWTRKYSVIFPWITSHARPLLIDDDKILIHVNGWEDYDSNKFEPVNLLRYHHLMSENGRGEEIYRGDHSLFRFEPFVHVESLVPL